MSDISHEQLKQILAYDPETGVFVYRQTRGKRRANKVAGVISRRSFHNGGGYRLISTRIGALRKLYGAHRLAWFYVHGEWPTGLIDHINGQRDDNRLANLRVASRSQNQANRGRPANNTTGLKGVSRHIGAGRYRATIQGKHLGLYDTAELAHAAYCRAAQTIFGEFARAV